MIMPWLTYRSYHASASTRTNNVTLRHHLLPVTVRYRPLLSVRYVDSDDNVTLHHPTVVRHYVLGWFLPDLASSLPIDRFVGAAEVRPRQGASTLTRLLPLIKLLRLVRLFKLVRYLRRWNDDLGWSALASQMTWLVFCVLTLLSTR